MAAADRTEKAGETIQHCRCWTAGHRCSPVGHRLMNCSLGEAMHLTIGNKCYSSWSLRPWLLMKVLGVPFTEAVVPLDTPEFRSTVDAISGAGKVPVIEDGGLTVWDSLAIAEYLADRFPDKAVWPADPAARAHARCISAEMHSGFTALRSACPMNLGKRFAQRDRGAAVEKDVARITGLWREARARFGAAAGGPFLYGAFTAADAMYAPVVTRLDTYSIAVEDEARAYMATVLSMPAFVEWRSAALAESWVLDHDEVDEAAIETFRKL